jgi:uncharacterized membrane protein SpoIIM required for sporulation
MIIDIARFQQNERPYWDELEAELDALDRDAARNFSLDQARRFHYLYRRTAADLTTLKQFPAEVGLHDHLETLVARAYAEIHETRQHSRISAIWPWFSQTIPQTFRRQQRSFFGALLLTAIGGVFGAAIVLYDYDSKGLVLPFSHLEGDPSDRVAYEEAAETDRMEGGKSTFSAMLMVNNIRVSIMALAFGMTFGIGTGILLYYNGVILGVVICDYILAGEEIFLMGWLLPHGSIEIPAILFGGQAGLVLGIALLGWGNTTSLRERLRAVRPDLVTLISAAALLLIWAGIIESFFSQYHEPYLPYWVKIGFGATQLFLLYFYLFRAGRSKSGEEHQG